MSFNFALILTLLTGFTGLIVAINKFVWQRADRWKTASTFRLTLVDYSQSFFPVLLFVLIVRSFVFEPSPEAGAITMAAAAPTLAPISAKPATASIVSALAPTISGTRALC